MRIAIASDHAALEMKAALVDWLQDAGHEVTDLGPMTADSVDYPDYGYKLASEVASGRVERGVALCGSGIGISMAVNRHPACRCALVSEGLSAKLAREHNDAKDCLDVFLKTEFGGDRHQRRVDKLSAPSIEGANA